MTTGRHLSMIRLRLKNHLHPALSTVPDAVLTKAPCPPTVAVAPERIAHIKPRLLVREGQLVKVGTPLFEDKRDPRIRFLSPGAGPVEAVRFGKRRVIREIVIRLNDDDAREAFTPLLPDALEDTPRETVVQRLLDGGLWSVIRQLPFRDYAHPEEAIPLMIVSLRPGDMTSPLPEIFLRDQEDLFLFGLDILKKLSPRIVVAAPAGDPDRLGAIAPLVTHTVDAGYPAGDPSVILYQIRTDVAENRACYVSGQDLIDIARLLSSGDYPTDRIYSVTGCLEKGMQQRHVLARRGSPVASLTGPLGPGTRTITQGLFNGFSPDFTDAHMGSFESSVTILRDDLPDELFGFARPGAARISQSRTFVSRLSEKPRLPDAHLHGEARACINCGMCARLCPVDLLPQFIMKAAMADELEEILALGILDCARCGLCSFVCPSKVELMQELDSAIITYYKDKS